MCDVELTSFRLKSIGFVFQFFNLIPTLNTVENVTLPLVVAGRTRQEIRERPLHLLEQVGLLNKANRMPFELSGGEQQRVAVARALANYPSIVLADEPTGNLDSKNSAKLIDLFNMINEENGQTFILATHDHEVARSADRIVYMKDCRIINDNRRKPRHRIIKNDVTRERLNVLRVLDELYASNWIRREAYERLRPEYMRRLIEIEITMNAS